MPLVDHASLLNSGAADALDAAVEAALGRGDVRDLPVIGFGEISTVLAWPRESARVAAKRLPLFASPQALGTYVQLLADYIAELERLGIAIVDTAVLAPADGPGRAFLLQPLADRLLSTVLAAAPAGDEEAGLALLAVVDVVIDGVDARLGLDAQVSNWAVSHEGTLVYLDVSTPFLRDRDGRDRLDVAWLCSVYPCALRPAIGRWAAPGVIAAYHDPRQVLLDVGANLHREGLERHVPALVEAAAARDVGVSPTEMRRYAVANRRTWKTLQVLRSADARWQRHIRRRPYPFLLPETTP